MTAGRTQRRVTTGLQGLPHNLCLSLALSWQVGGGGDGTEANYFWTHRRLRTPIMLVPEFSFPLSLGIWRAGRHRVWVDLFTVSFGVSQWELGLKRKGLIPFYWVQGAPHVYSKRQRQSAVISKFIWLCPSPCVWGWGEERESISFFPINFIL